MPQHAVTLPTGTATAALAADSQRRAAIWDGYAASLSNALLHPVEALCAYRAAQEMYAWDAQAATAVWSRATAAVIGSLPLTDPWKHIATATADWEIAQSWQPDPQADIATASTGVPWEGGWLDAVDLARIDHPDPARDPGLAPVAEPLPVGAVSLYAAACYADWVAQHAVKALRRRRVSVPEIWSWMDGALRRAVFRRQQYTGADDRFSVAAIHEAVATVNETLARGGGPLERCWLDVSGRISEEMYEAIAQSVAERG